MLIPRNMRPSNKAMGYFRILLGVASGTLGLLIAVATYPTLGDELSLDGAEGRPLALQNFRPRPQLILPNNQPPRAKFPVVDVHVHPRLKLHHSAELLANFVAVMDEQRVAVAVSLDGELGDSLLDHKRYLCDKFENRFLFFANIPWVGSGSKEDVTTWDCHRPGFGRLVAERLKVAKSRGAAGLKVFKTLGLTWKNIDGSYIPIDDERWDPIWEACGALGLPVLIHSADPPAFFEPTNAENERWEELQRHPDWSYYGKGTPSHAELLAARNRIIARHPKTVFICAHMGSSPHDLNWLSKALDEHPNMMLDITSRIAELGRQPRAARRFFVRYADRILFGTDGPRPAARYLPHWRFLETADEYFPYAENPFPPQGLWNIDGLDLPDDVLRKIYYENASRLIPGVREKLAPFLAVD